MVFIVRLRFFFLLLCFDHRAPVHEEAAAHPNTNHLHELAQDTEVSEHIPQGYRDVVSENGEPQLVAREGSERPGR